MKMDDSTIDRLIWVEGNSDLQVVRTLRQYAMEQTQFWIERTGGVQQLLNNVPNDLQNSKFIGRSPTPALGYVVDADDDHQTIWEKLKTRCRDVSIPEQYRVWLPDEPNPDGTIVMRPRPRLKVGVWVMPDNEHPGELEDFLVSMVPCNETDWHLARKYVHNSERKFGKKVTRAEVLSWIATRMYPGRFDEAIKNGDLRTDGELCQTFIAWLSRLFAPDEEVANTA